MARVIDVLPELTGDEMVYIQNIIQTLDDESARTFAHAYRARRKDPQSVLITAILGFVIIAGVHRFLLGQIAMGLLYLFTAGFCFIGTIIDIVNYQKLAFEYNSKTANEVLVLVRPYGNTRDARIV